MRRTEFKLSHEPTIQTVLGPVLPSDLGITMSHEHVFTDLRHMQIKPAPKDTNRTEPRWEQPLTIEDIGSVRRDPLLFNDNLVLDDVAQAVNELAFLRAAGGRHIVELTPIGVGQDPGRLARVAEESGVGIIASVGFYTAPSHPPSLRTMSVHEVADLLLQMIHQGVDGGVRPGAIGEIGTSDPVSPEEWKVVDAAARAQIESGLPLFIHVAPTGSTAPDVAKRVLNAGVDPSRVVICHMPGNRDPVYHDEVAELGVNLGFDNFGLDAYFDSGGRNEWCFDPPREELLLRRFERGELEQVLVSQDVCMKFQLRAYGGHGYSHFLENVVPRLIDAGLDDSDLAQLLVDNPRRLLTPA